MANPSITALPDAPQRRMARDVYPVVADKWAAALGPWTTEVNAVVTWMGQQIDAAAASKKAASDSATAAGQAVSDAQAQVKLATDQAVASKASADSSAASLASNQAIAQAVKAATGLPQIIMPGAVIRQKLDGSGNVEYWNLVVSQVGDTVLSTQAPDPTWILTGATYPQNSYPALYAKLGKLPDFRDDQITTSGLPSGSATISAGMPAYGGGTLLVMGVVSATNSYAFHYSKDLGATWASVNKPANYYVNALVFGNGVFVGPDQGGTYANIFDPSTNQISVYNLPSQSTWTLAEFGNNMFICMMNSINIGNYATSTDNGKTWTARNAPNDLQPGALKFFNGMFMLFDARSVNYYYTSTDGINWSKRTLPGTFGITNKYIAITNGTLAIMSGVNFYKTTNGTVWSSSLGTNPISTAQSSGIFLAAGDGVFAIFTDTSTAAKIFYSMDGVSWGFRNKVLTPTTQTLGSLPIYAAGNFVFFVSQANYMWKVKPYSYNTASLFYSVDAPAFAQVGLNQYIKAS